jgi:hypothetical protein
MTPMADQPEDDLPVYKILVVAKEYRTYTVVGNGQDDARVRLLAHRYDYDYDRGDDSEDDLEVVEIWEE